MSATACRADRFGAHDYSQPPHASRDEPRPLGYYGDSWTKGECCAQSSSLSPCEHNQRYEIVMFCIGTHEWITLRACAPCTASIRARHRPDDIHSIVSLRATVAAGQDGERLRLPDHRESERLRTQSTSRGIVRCPNYI